MTADYWSNADERDRNFKRREAQIKEERAQARKEDTEYAQKQYPYKRALKGLKGGRAHLF